MKILIFIILAFALIAKGDIGPVYPDSSEYQYSLYTEPDGVNDIFIETRTFAPGLTRRQMIVEIGHATEKGGGALIGQGSASSTERITSCNASTYDGYNYWYNLPQMAADK